jgi:hypothetical protein
VGVIYTYFAATSDEVASAAIDLAGGPGGAEPASPELRAAMRTGDREAMFRLLRPRVRTSEHGLRVLTAKGVDPVIQLGAVETLLTGRPAGPRDGDPVAIRDGGERLVLTVTQELCDALATHEPDRFDAVAGDWSRTEDFSGQADPEPLANFLRELAHLAQGARAEDQRLYCWVCV